MAHFSPTAAFPLRPRCWWSILILLLAGSFALASAAAPPAAGAVNGTVQISAVARPSGSQARSLADSVYPHGASNTMDLPTDPPVAAVYAIPDDDATRAAVTAFLASAPKAPDATVTQKNLCFVPQLLPVRVGTTVAFPNEDDIYHNVFSYSPTKPFDLGRYRKGESAAKVTFDKPGVIKVFCEIHEHMRCTILVLDTPFFTLSDPAGHYQLSGLPPGKYTLTAWISDKHIWSRPLEILPGQTAASDLAPPQ